MQLQSKTNQKTPACTHSQMENHWMYLVPICSLPLGQVTTPMSP